VSERGAGDDGIFEKRSGAADVGVRDLFLRVDEHALGAADLANGVVDIERRGVGIFREVALEIRVGEDGTGRRIKAKSNAEDDVAIAVSGVEDAGAIGESAFGVLERDEGGSLLMLRVQVKGGHGVDGLGDLLSVGADILYGATADEAGNACETFDAGEIDLADGLYKFIPRTTRDDRGGNEPGAARRTRIFDGSPGLEAKMKDEAGKAVVRYEDIAAAAEDEDGEAAAASKSYGFEEMVRGDDGSEIARGTADAEGGVGGEENVFLDEAGKLMVWCRHGLRVQQLPYLNEDEDGCEEEDGRNGR
jgi:hypothetical protein